MKMINDPGSTLFQGSQKVKRKTLKNQLADKLAYMICSGLLLEGDSLPGERELASTFGVSRETVRGALQVLESREMIVVAHGARTRVTKDFGASLNKPLSTYSDLEAYDVGTVSEARRVVEVAVLREAAIRIDKKSLERLQALLVAQSEMLDDPVAFQISDQEFHHIIYQSGGNQLLESFAVDTYAYALEFRHIAMKQENAVLRSYREHIAIVKALEIHDPEGSEKAICNHLDSIYRTTVDTMMENKK